VKAGGSNPILSIVQRCHTENAEGMYVTTTDGRKYWQPGIGELYLDFDEAKIVQTIAAGNRIVPEAMYAACKQAHVDHHTIDLLITTQPSLIFLRNWREAVEVPKEKHLDTFAELGNLFGAAIPINLRRAIEERRLNVGDYLMLAGFSHAGDFSAAALVHWNTDLCA
jgi:3-oxoacyl-[acyl-carrier-protein] synthase-3